MNIRLLSICPPDALRPYYQEGYLAGTDDITTDYDSKDELDFNNRLIAKFRLSRNKSFWGSGFSQVPEFILYPKNDRFKEICSSIQTEVGTEIDPSHLGKFLQEWTGLESMLLSMARNYQERVFSLKEAIIVLSKKEILPIEFRKQIDDLRQLRNLAVHDPNRLGQNELAEALRKVILLKDDMKTLKY